MACIVKMRPPDMASRPVRGAHVIEYRALERKAFGIGGAARWMGLMGQRHATRPATQGVVA